MSDLPVILAAIQNSESRLRQDIQGLGNRVNNIELKSAEHRVEIKNLKGQIANLWHKIKPPDSRGEYAGKPDLWFSLVEWFGEKPKIWHFFLIIISTIAGVIIKKADVLWKMVK